MTAAAARKLQKEIENVLKKVEDGIGEFDEFFEQATAAANSQQKERLGEELKKSINKLQRLRAQMREWIGQNAVPSGQKDKLEEYRRKIEHDMHRFKDFERDLKTKAFSTCALGQETELGMEEAEKLKYQEWLTSTIQALNDQLDTFEADLELLGNKKSLSSDDKFRSGQLKTVQERHRWHIKKLEQLLRASDNDAIEMSDLAVINDSVDLYVETHQDPDYYHDEGLYDCFDLAEYEESKSVKPSSEVLDCSTPVGSKEEPVKKGKEKEKQRKADKKDKKKEEKLKKDTTVGGTTPMNSGGGSTKAAASPTITDSLTPKVVEVSLLDQLDLDEVKVQEDQLLSEAEEFICKICQIHVVGCSPKLTSCSHLFCGDCIAQWFAQHPESQSWAQRAKNAGSERVVPCPVCKQPLGEKRDLYPVCGLTSRSENLLLWRMLSSLKIMCANHPKADPKNGKCEWIGEYGSYQKHIKVCKNVAGCEAAMASPVSEAHTQMMPPPILSLEAESEAAESSTDVSRLTTPAVTPAHHPAAAPAVRMSPMPTPVLEPQQAPRPEVVVAASSPVHEARSPVSAAPQVRPSPAPTTPAPTTTDTPSRKGGMWEAAKKQAETPTNAERNVPAAPAPSEMPVVNRTKSAEAEPVVAAPSKTGAATSHDSKVTQRQLHEDHKATSPVAADMEVVKAASSFEPTGPQMVQVAVGDRIQVLEKHSSGWTYCKNLTSGSSNIGWVPSWISQAAAAPEPARPQVVKPKATASLPPAPAPSSAPNVSAPAHKAVQAAAAVVPVPSPAPAAEARTYIRATAPFSAATQSQMSLAPADLIDIVERHSSGWTYGRKVQEPSAAVIEGWFPDWVIAQTK